MPSGLPRLNLQAKEHASRFRALVLIGVAAAFCAAVIPHITKPSVASKLAEAEHRVAFPPQWLPLLLASEAFQLEQTRCARPDWPLHDISRVKGWVKAKHECYLLTNCAGFVYDVRDGHAWLKSEMDSPPPLCGTTGGNRAGSPRLVGMRRQYTRPPRAARRGALVTAYSAGSTIGPLSEISLRLYAYPHGYTVLATHVALSDAWPAAPNFWRYPAVVVCLRSGFAWCFHVDHDAVVLQPSVSVETGWASLDSTGAPLLFVDDGGAMPINTAVFLAIGTQSYNRSALSFLKRFQAFVKLHQATQIDPTCVRSGGKKATFYGISDQTCLSKFVAANRMLDGAATSTTRRALDETSVRTVSYRHACREGHRPWPKCNESAAFVLHLAVMSNEHRAGRLLRVLNRQLHLSSAV